MSDTQITSDQQRFVSAKTGTHTLDAYLEACERTGLTLSDLIDLVFDANGGILPAAFNFRVNGSGLLQFRSGVFADPEASWQSMGAYVFRNRGAHANATAYDRLDLVTYGGNAYYCNTAHTSSTAAPSSDFTQLVTLGDNLVALSGLAGAADKLAYFTGATTMALATITSQARNLLDDTTSADMRTTLGLGTAATENYGTSANQLVRLDASAKLPAVDGSQLTNVKALPRSYLAGLSLANNATDATNDIDIAAGEARDSTNAQDIILATLLTKRLDAAWAVGTNQGGLDTGAIGNNTYHVWLIKRSDTGVVDALFSLSATAPTMPANYDYKRRIGSIVRTGGAIKSFTQLGDEFLWNTPVLDVNQTNPGTAAVTRTLTLPTGVKIWAMVRAQIYFTSAVGQRPYLLLSSLDETDNAPSGNAAPWADVGWFSDTDANLPIATRTVRTNTSAQIRSRQTTSDANTKIAITTFGYIDRRGRDD